MKKLIFLFFVSIYFLALAAQTDYYWYKGKKIPLQKDSTQKFILFEDLPDTNVSDKLIKYPGVKILDHRKTALSDFVVPYGNKEIKKLNWAVVSDTIQKGPFTNNDQVSYESYFYKTPDGIEAGLSNLFYVKLERKEEEEIIEIISTKVTFFGNFYYFCQVCG